MTNESLIGDTDSRKAFEAWIDSGKAGIPKGIYCLTRWETWQDAVKYGEQAAEQRILDMLGSEKVAEALAKVLDPNCFIGTEKEIHRYCSPRLVSYCQDQVKHTAKAALAAIKGRIGG